MSEASPIKRALAAIDDLQRKLKALEAARNEPIAIVGIGCRLPPEISGPEELWRELVRGVDAVCEVPDDRWNAQELYDADPAEAGRMVTTRGAFLKDISGFDAGYFGLSPAEARAMDPQQRILLEVVWNALTDAGLPEEKLRGTPVGLFIGAASSDYRDLAYADRGGIGPYSATGTSNSVLAGRIAYLLDLRGPAITVDTACSSSLVAVHMACQSLRLGECDVAVAGGVHAMVTPEPMIASSKMGLLSQDGVCRSFDAAATGVGIGEGCGAVVLKRLRDAMRDNDRITAVIRGSATNQDGRSNGLTAPNGVAQVAVIRRALEAAAIEGGTIGYVETHGTGTPLGDPIEAEALVEALGKQGETCWLGALKTNFGHLTAAAGVVGLIKAALVVERGLVPPNLHFSTLNPQIDFASAPRFRIPTESSPWSQDGVRRGSVSSFGWSGSNCHVVLEQAADACVAAPATGPQVLMVSAQDPVALEHMIDRYRDFLSPGGGGVDLPLADICYTAAARRTHHEHRRVAVGWDHAEIAAALASEVQREWPRDLEAPVRAYLAGARPDIARLFPKAGRCVRLVEYAWNRQSYWLEGNARPLLSAGAGSARPRGELRTRLAAEPRFRRREVLVQFVCGEVAKVLGLDENRPVDVEEGFFQLGMTSLGAVSLHRRLEAACDQRWPTATVFENRRVVELVDFLQNGALKDLFEDGNSARPAAADDVMARLRQTLDRLSDAKSE